MRRRLTLAVVAATASWSPLSGQRAQQFEIGAYGALFRYDQVFALEHQAGFGGRVAYFMNETVGLEVDAGRANATVTALSASLVLNFGGGRHLAYVLGGYSRLDFGPATPYRFTDNAIHGAIGDRILLSRRLALRLEARGIYAPNTGFAGGDWAGHLVGSAGLSVFAGAGAMRDFDRDGVPERRDACAATPLGAVVDPAGCPLDSDRDLVFNGLDACPNTVFGAQVDPHGCPLDGDRDGVYDGLDQCDATPAGVSVDARGCATDGDGDGVADGLDQCPATPSGASVDANGCPSDGDRDGVLDGLDKCPGTVAGTRVDTAGCPVLFTPDRVLVVLRGVTFETGRSALRPESNAVLDVVAASLLANPEIRIEIAGHTDATGSQAVNRRLSQARAGAVRAYLARNGVEPNRMVARGYGPDQPVATNLTAAGRAQNRRVELRQLP